MARDHAIHFHTLHSDIVESDNPIVFTLNVHFGLKHMYVNSLKNTKTLSPCFLVENLCVFYQILSSYMLVVGLSHVPLQFTVLLVVCQPS